MERLRFSIAFLLVCSRLPVLQARTIAYDCEDAATEVSTISLREVAPCPRPETTYTTKQTQVTILQRDELKYQRVWTCLIEVVRVISYCGMHSHSSMVSGGLSNYVHRVGADECRLIHRDKTLRLFANTIGDIRENSTTTASITLLGQLDSDGTCAGTMYQENGQTWKNVVITAAVTVRLRDFQTIVKLDENEIVLDKGVTCPFLTGYCFDAEIGEAVWSTDQPVSCVGHLAPLFEGQAQEISSKQSEQVLLAVTAKSHLFALTYVKRGIICDQEVWFTEHPRIVIAQGSHNWKADEVVQQDVDLMSYVNSKFLYVEQAFKRDIDQLYVDAIHRRCLLHREILRNRLMMAPFIPHVLGQLVQEQEGYVGRVLGEVLYILKCAPVSVSLRRTDRCYNELPIEVNNKSMFMAPITRIIQATAEEVDCSAITPPLYLINNEWIGLTPHPTMKHAPKQLEVDEKQRLNLTPIEPLGTLGLYTQNEVEKVQKLLTFGAERRAAENIITRRVLGMDTHGQGISPILLFNEEEMKNLAESTIRQMWGWFSELGLFVSGIIGFYVVFRLIKYCIEVVINGVQIYRTIGGGFHMLAMFWNTLSMWLLQRPERRQRRREGDEEAEFPDDQVAETSDYTSRLAPHSSLPVLAPTPQQRDLNKSAPHLMPASSSSHWTDEQGPL